MPNERIVKFAQPMPTKALIRALVHGLYAEVRENDGLGAIFKRTIAPFGGTA